MNNTSATMELMRRAGGKPTLDRWLELNACDPTALLNAELLEIVPECLRSELEDIMRFQNRYRAIEEHQSRS